MVEMGLSEELQLGEGLVADVRELSPSQWVGREEVTAVVMCEAGG